MLFKTSVLRRKTTVLREKRGPKARQEILGFRASRENEAAVEGLVLREPWVTWDPWAHLDPEVQKENLEFLGVLVLMDEKACLVNPDWTESQEEMVWMAYPD